LRSSSPFSERTGEHEYFLIQVKDTGRGIPEDKLRDVFVPFTQVHHEQKKVEGSGLGLSLAKKITEKLGGTLEVQSKVGKGTTFHLKIPLKVLPRGSLCLPMEDLFSASGLGITSQIPEDMKEELIRRKNQLSVVIMASSEESHFCRILSSYLTHWGIPYRITTSFPERGKKEKEWRREKGEGREAVRYLIEDVPEKLFALLSILDASEQVPEKPDSPSEPRQTALLKNETNLGTSLHFVNVTEIELRDKGAQEEVIFLSTFQQISSIKKETEGKENQKRIHFLKKTGNPSELFKVILLSLGIIFEHKDPPFERALSFSFEEGEQESEETSIQDPHEGEEQQENEGEENPTEKRQEDVEDEEERTEALVVEDNEVSQLIMKKILEKYGVSIN